jgi:glutamate carboxypeptidase
LLPVKARLREVVRAHHDEDITLMDREVDIPSGTQNIAGVRQVGAMFATELTVLEFTLPCADISASMHRACHLIAQRHRTKGPRLLLIGHLDTVFEAEGQHSVHEDPIPYGAGTSNMKGGDVAIISALRALNATGALEGSQITVIMTGDEEAAGSQLVLARRDPIDTAGRNDIALAFDGGCMARATIARRGSSSWTLNFTARQGHSAGAYKEIRSSVEGRTMYPSSRLTSRG